MTRTALQARCAIVMPIATMRVQNYADSGIKCGLRLTGDVFVPVFIRTTVGQYYN